MEGKRPSQIPYSHEKTPEHVAQLRADQEVKKQLTPEEALNAIKERGRFYGNVYMNLSREIEKIIRILEFSRKLKPEFSRDLLGWGKR
jgi:hypothetical protein